MLQLGKDTKIIGITSKPPYTLQDEHRRRGICYNWLMAKAQAVTASDDKSEAPHKYFEDQFDDEEVLYVFRRHPIVMRKGLIIGMLGPLIGVIPAAAKPELGFGIFFGGMFGGFALGMFILAFSWVPWYFSVYIMTDQRFIQISQKGFFNKAVSDITLSQIQSINYEVKGMEQTLLGFGTILIQTYLGDLLIHDVHHPAKTARKIQLILRDLNVQPTLRPVSNVDPTSDEAYEDT